MFDNELANKYLESLENELGMNDSFTIESCLTIIEAYDRLLFDEEDEVTTEGANIESTKVFFRFKKELKSLMKQYRTAMKDNDFDKARRYADNMITVGNNILKELRSIQGDAFSTMIGNIIELVRSYGVIILVGAACGFSIGGAIGAAGLVAKSKLVTKVAAPLIGTGVAGIVVAIKDHEKKLNDLAREVHETKRAQSNSEAVDRLNKYKNTLIHTTEDLVKKAKVLKDAVDEKEKKYKEKVDSEKKDIKESTNVLFNNLKKSLYEDCQNGVISVEERESTINDLKEILYAKQIIAEESLDMEDYATKEEVFSTIKKAMYERCAAGEFSEDVREDLIRKAYDQIFPVKEDAVPTPAANNTSNNYNTNGMNKELEKTLNDAKKNIEKNNDNSTKKLGEELDKGMSNPVGDPPIKESVSDMIDDAEDLDALIESWDRMYQESAIIDKIKEKINKYKEKIRNSSVAKKFKELKSKLNSKVKKLESEHPEEAKKISEKIEKLSEKFDNVTDKAVKKIDEISSKNVKEDAATDIALMQQQQMNELTEEQLRQIAQLEQQAIEQQQQVMQQMQQINQMNMMMF